MPLSSLRYNGIVLCSELLKYAAKWGDHETIRRRVPKRTKLSSIALQRALESPHATAETVSLLIELGTDPNVPGLYGEPLLCIPHDEAKTRALLEGGADARATREGYSVLLSERPYDLGRLRLLLDEGADPNAVGARGETALEYALRTGRSEAIALLLERGARLDLTGLAPLQLAVYLGTCDDIERALGAGGTPHDQTREYTPDAWEIALTQGRLDKAQALLDAGADRFRRNDWGRTPLMVAARADQPDLVRWLLGLGAPVDERNKEEQTALIHASESGATRVVTALLDAGANVDATDRTESRAISSAANIDIVRMLAGHGADVDYVNGEGKWALAYAADEGDEAFVRELLGFGVNVETNSIGETALHFAVNRDERNIVRMLLEAGADPNAQELLDGERPLHYVRSPDVAEMLLRAGADPRAKTKQGSAAVEFTNEPEVRALLEAAP